MNPLRPALACVLFASAAACGPSSTPALSAERIVLEREQENLLEYLHVDFGRLLVEGDLLAVIREGLVDEVLAASLPLEGEIEGGYRIRLEAARVSLRTGLALVELDGRASLADRPTVFADLTLYASLDVIGIRGDPPRLDAALEPLALEARQVRVGELSPPAMRLIEELARRRLEALGSLIGPIQLPVSIERSIGLPAVEDGDVRIEAVEVDVGAEVESFLVADGRLWILVGFDLHPASPSAPDGEIQP